MLINGQEGPGEVDSGHLGEVSIEYQGACLEFGASGFSDISEYQIHGFSMFV